MTRLLESSFIEALDEPFEITPEIWADIEEVVNMVAPKFKFGYLEIEDVKQEARMAALKGLRKYDRTRPLKNFLHVHIRNRLINLKRDTAKKPEAPCTNCEFFDEHYEQSENQCLLVLNKDNCDKWAAYCKKSAAAHNIMNPTDITNLDEDGNIQIAQNYNLDTKLDLQELFERVDVELPIEYRSDYIKFKSGVVIPKSRRDKLIEKLKEIILNVGKSEEAQEG